MAGIIIEKIIWVDDLMPNPAYMIFTPFAFQHGMVKSLDACGVYPSPHLLLGLKCSFGFIRDLILDKRSQVGFQKKTCEEGTGKLIGTIYINSSLKKAKK
jgi:hypothetical protein